MAPRLIRQETSSGAPAAAAYCVPPRPDRASRGNSITNSPGIADAAGDARRLVAGAEIDVGARRPDDGRAGILREHEAAEFRRRLLVGDRQIGGDEERRAVDVQRTIDRNRAAGHQRHALAADRLVLGGKIGDAEEDVGFVLPPHVLGLVRIGLHPFADALHRHFVLGDDLAIDQHAADRRIGPAIMRIVVDAQNGAVFQPDAGRALNLREQHVDLAAQPADFQMPAVERAVLDLAAVVIGHDLAAADAAADLDALAGKRIAELAPAGDDQIGRPAIERRGELAGRHARAVDDRLVIAGEKAVRVAELADAQRPEIVLEEFPRALLLERNGRDGALADVLERLGDRRRLAARLPGAVERAAAGEKGRKRRGVIVVRPAVERPPNRPARIAYRGI